MNEPDFDTTFWLESRVEDLEKLVNNLNNLLFQAETRIEKLEERKCPCQRVYG